MLLLLMLILLFRAEIKRDVACVECVVVPVFIYSPHALVDLFFCSSFESLRCLELAPPPGSHQPPRSGVACVEIYPDTWLSVLVSTHKCQL